MDKKNKTLAISVVLVGIGAYLVVNWIKKHKKSEPSGAINPITGSLKLVDRDKMLSKGSKGSEVALLQNKLGNLFIDGIFGDKTEARLKQVKGVTQITLSSYDKK